MAFGAATINDAAGGVSDIFAGIGEEYKAEGAQFEQQSYQEAEQLALQNQQFAKTSTAIKQGQADRALFTSLGATTAAEGNSGLATSGSAIDILRQSASEGATTRAVLGQQGLIQEAGFAEQAQSYENMANAAGVAIKADQEAEIGDDIGAGLKGVAAIATLVGA
jgi:hypothetical protein